MSTDEAPFAGLVGLPLTSAAPVFDEVNEVVGVTLTFGDRALTLNLREGEIDMSAG